MNTIAPEVLKELDELIVQLIKNIKKKPAMEKIKALTELVEWKNETRREWVDMLTRAAEKETDSNTMRLLIKEANKLMKEVTK